MHLAHLGIAVFIVGVAMVGGYQDREGRQDGSRRHVSVGGYTFRFNGVARSRGRTTGRWSATST
jgi:cytochrome c-type biogenesis protein CcmF